MAKAPLALHPRDYKGPRIPGSHVNVRFVSLPQDLLAQDLFGRAGGEDSARLEEDQPIGKRRREVEVVADGRP